MCKLGEEVRGEMKFSRLRGVKYRQKKNFLREKKILLIEKIFNQRKKIFSCRKNFLPAENVHIAIYNARVKECTCAPLISKLLCSASAVDITDPKMGLPSRTFPNIAR